MTKEFFYLDGKDQKGPFTIDQLKQVGLKPDTLVWTEEFESWKPAKDVSELADLIKKTPPPPPIIDSYQSVTVATNENPTKTKTLVEDSNVKLWATVKIISLILLLFIVVAFVGYSFVDTKRANLKKEIAEKIAYVFGTKSEVLDGEKTGVQGEEETTNYGKEKTKKKEKLTWIKLGKDSVQMDLNNFSTQTWAERDGLYTIFKCTKGGFTIKKLTKLNDESFDLETYYSGDMGYRKPEFSRGITGWSYNEYGENNTYGNIRNYRKSVQSCYNEAFDFFTKDDKTGAYTAGKLIDITTFPDIRNEYFYMDNTAPKLYSSSGHFSADWWSSDDHTANVFCEDARVYYSSKGKHYELTLNEDKFKKDLLLTIGISCGILLLLVIVIGVSKPKFFPQPFIVRQKMEKYFVRRPSSFL